MVFNDGNIGELLLLYNKQQYRFSGYGLTRFCRNRFWSKKAWLVSPLNVSSMQRCQVCVTGCLSSSITITDEMIAQMLEIFNYVDVNLVLFNRRKRWTGIYRFSYRGSKRYTCLLLLSFPGGFTGSWQCSWTRQYARRLIPARSSGAQIKFVWANSMWLMRHFGIIEQNISESINFYQMRYSNQGKSES